MRYLDKSYFTTKAAGVALVLLLLISLAYNTSRSRNGDIKAIKIITSYPVVLPHNARLVIIGDTVPVYYYKNYVMYSLPYTKAEEKNGIILKHEKNFNHFVFEINGKFGFWYDSASSENGKVVPVDSVLFHRGYATNFNIKADTISGITRENGVIIEKYIPKRFYGEDYYDSAYYYFSKDFNDVSHSLSKNLDSMRAERLFKVRLIYNEKFSPTYNFTAPKREYQFKIEKVVHFNYDETLGLFKKFQSNASHLPK